MAAIDDILIPSLTLEEVLSDGSTLSNPAADHRRLFLGEDGLLHLRDSAGAVTTPSIAATLLDAKGDLIAASAADTAARLAAAANGASLITASGETTGLKWRLNNDGAAVAPAVTDDSGDGYSIGSRWLDTTADKEYVCLDASIGAAVWVETTATGGGGSGALVLLEQHTAAASASLDFTTFISSTYDNYLIEATDIALVTNGALLYIEVGTGGGPTWDTGNTYQWAMNGRTINGAAATDNGATGLARIFNTLRNDAGYGTGTFSLIATALQSTAHRKTLHGTLQYVTSADESVFGTFGMQWTTTATAATGLRFIASSGNIASGTIRIYGLTK